jgi:hypothetical protein
MDRFNNGLAGWASTFTLRTHNDRPRCLFDLSPLTTTTTTTASPFPTTTTTSTTSTTSTTTTPPGTCNNSQFVVLQTGAGFNSFVSLGDACTALAGGGLTTSFGNLWISGSNLDSSTNCIQTKGGQYPLYTNSSLTTQSSYNPTFPYVIMANITYGSAPANAVIMNVDYIGGNTYITQENCTNFDYYLINSCCSGSKVLAVTQSITLAGLSYNNTIAYVDGVCGVISQSIAPTAPDEYWTSSLQVNTGYYGNPSSPDLYCSYCNRDNWDNITIPNGCLTYAFNLSDAAGAGSITASFLDCTNTPVTASSSFTSPSTDPWFVCASSKPTIINRVPDNEFFWAYSIDCSGCTLI